MNVDALPVVPVPNVGRSVGLLHSTFFNVCLVFISFLSSKKSASVQERTSVYTCVTKASNIQVWKWTPMDKVGYWKTWKNGIYPNNGITFNAGNENALIFAIQRFVCVVA